MKPVLLHFAGWVAGWLPAGIIKRIYSFRPVASLVRRVLNAAAPVGQTEVAVAGGLLQGARLLLDLQTEKDYWLGSYEIDLQAAIRDWVKPGMVVYDVGANIGYISIMMARQAGHAGQVFAFEPLPANIERLRKNVELNGLESVVTIIPSAVVEAVRLVNFLVSTSGGMGKAAGSAGRQEIPYQGSIELEGISLDYFVFEQGHPAPGLVKLDIEGGEVLALPGMRRMLSECQPVVLLELHGPEAAQAAWEALVSQGYRICQMQSGNPEVTSADKIDWKAYLLALPAGIPPA